MQRIPKAFVPNEHGLATARPSFQWFANGLGIASRKWDGLPVLVNPLEDGSYGFFRGIRFDQALPPPPRFIESGRADGEVSGWMPARPDDPDLNDALRSIFEAGLPISPGTYELVGPDIKGNPEGFDHPTLLKHGAFAYLRCPRTLEDLIVFLIANPSEGIVWEYEGAMCQLTRADVGLDWPEDGA